MITVRQENKLLERIKTLSELEFSALLKQMSEHIAKNNWEHIIDECFDIDDYEDELAESAKTIERLEEENNDLENKLFEIEKLCSDAEDVEEFEDGAFEKIVGTINKIRDEI